MDDDIDLGQDVVMDEDAGGGGGGGAAPTTNKDIRNSLDIFDRERIAVTNQALERVAGLLAKV